MSRNSLMVLSALALSSVALNARAEPLLDYRDNAFLSGNPFYSAQERAAVETALKRGPNEVAEQFADDFAIRGDASGTFSTDGADERIYLIQQEAAVAIEPFPDEAAPLLLVMSGNEPIAFYALPDDVQYQRLVAVADIDDDGRDEVFLESSFMNMGQMTMSIDIASLASGTNAEIVQRIDEVYLDGCENPVGAKVRKAMTISVADGIKSETFEDSCP
jgi:hypothetical protein